MNQMKVATHVLNGRRVGYFVDLVTLGSAETLKEALDYNYVTGKESSLAAVAEGVLKAMIDGIRKDGNGRKIDDFVSINAFAKGSLKDICDELNKQDVKVSVRARMLKEFKVDTTQWSFIIEGSTGTFTIEVVTTGEKLGEIVLGEDVKLNGKGLAMGEGDSVSWSVPETGESGTVGASSITSDATRITIARDGLQELFVAANDGKTIVFTARIGGKKSVKSATMKYVG